MILNKKHIGLIVGMSFLCFVQGCKGKEGATGPTGAPGVVPLCTGSEVTLTVDCSMPIINTYPTLIALHNNSGNTIYATLLQYGGDLSNCDVAAGPFRTTNGSANEPVYDCTSAPTGPFSISYLTSNSLGPCLLNASGQC